jgi:hypothetical protein
MDLHIYTRELLDKHLLPELKEIAQSLGIIPEGNKTRRETWVAALVGKPCPVFQSIENSLDAEVDPAEEPIVHAPESEKSSGVEFDPAQAPLMEAAETSPGVEFDPAQAPLMEAAETSPGVEFDPAQVPLMEVAETSPGVEFDPAQAPLMEAAETSPGVEVDPVQEPIEFPDLESALAEIARLRTQNDELLSRVRSQSEEIPRAKDISPVEKPSLKRVLALAHAACLDVLKSTEGNWILSMGRLRRSFKKLRDIWDLLIVDDWYLTDLFSPPPLPVAKKTLFTVATHTRYSAVPFCDDGLIDSWSLGVNAVSSGRSPPAGGEAM